MVTGLQEEKRQLMGKSAQQSRELRETTAALEVTRSQLTDVQRQLDRQMKGHDSKEVALNKYVTCHWLHLQFCEEFNGAICASKL